MDIVTDIVLAITCSDQSIDSCHNRNAVSVFIQFVHTPKQLRPKQIRPV